MRLNSDGQLAARQRPTGARDHDASAGQGGGGVHSPHGLHRHRLEDVRSPRCGHAEAPGEGKREEKEGEDKKEEEEKRRSGEEQDVNTGRTHWRYSPVEHSSGTRGQW